MLKNEKYLLERLSEGDNIAFKEVFGHYYPKVKCFLYRYINDEDEVKDIAQNIFVKIWNARKLLPEIRNFNTYLYTITRNMAIDYYRSHKIGLTLDKVSELEEVGNEATDQEIIAKEMGENLAKKIRRMPKKRREIFIMSKLEGKANGDIAEELGLSKKTVESHLYLSLKELKKLLPVITVIFLIFFK